MPIHNRDLTIEAVLADPMIRALMAADGVRRHDLEALLHEKSRTLRAARAAPVLQSKPKPTWAFGMCLA